MPLSTPPGRVIRGWDWRDRVGEPSAGMGRCSGWPPADGGLPNGPRDSILAYQHGFGPIHGSSRRP